MTEKENKNLITIILAIIILVAVITVVYVNLPKEDKKICPTKTTQDDTDDNQMNYTKIILTIKFNDSQLQYNLKDLENLSSTTSTGRYIKYKALKQGNVIFEPELTESPWEFTGIDVITLINQFENITEKYNITVTASDNYFINYTKDNATGIIDVYNQTGNVIGNSGATMILAYKQNGEYITDEEEGPLRIAFIGEDVITTSNLWLKMVETIEIIEV